jgi:hypothetical protein
MEEERTLLVKGEETTTLEAVNASNSRVPGVHVHQENTQFSTNRLMECQLQMHEMAQKLVSSPLFSFQDLKLSTRDIIAILEDTLNTTLGPLPIPDQVRCLVTNATNYDVFIRQKALFPPSFTIDN